MSVKIPFDTKIDVYKTALYETYDRLVGLKKSNQINFEHTDVILQSVSNKKTMTIGSVNIVALAAISSTISGLIDMHSNGFSLNSIIEQSDSGYLIKFDAKPHIVDIIRQVATGKKINSRLNHLVDFVQFADFLGMPFEIFHKIVDEIMKPTESISIDRYAVTKCKICDNELNKYFLTGLLEILAIFDTQSNLIGNIQMRDHILDKTKTMLDRAFESKYPAGLFDYCECPQKKHVYRMSNIPTTVFLSLYALEFVEKSIHATIDHDRIDEPTKTMVKETVDRMTIAVIKQKISQKHVYQICITLFEKFDFIDIPHHDIVEAISKFESATGLKFYGRFKENLMVRQKLLKLKQVYTTEHPSLVDKYTKQLYVKPGKYDSNSNSIRVLSTDNLAKRFIIGFDVRNENIRHKKIRRGTRDFTGTSSSTHNGGEGRCNMRLKIEPSDVDPTAMYDNHHFWRSNRVRITYDITVDGQETERKVWYYTLKPGKKVESMVVIAPIVNFDTKSDLINVEVHIISLEVQNI